MANFNLNRVILGGRICVDPDLQTTASGTSVCTVRVAVNRPKKGEDGKPITDFFNVVAWKSTAEFLCRYFHKGDSVCVEGVLNTRSFVDKKDILRQITEVVADNVHFVDSKAEKAAAAPAPEAPSIPDVAENDDLPF